MKNCFISQQNFKRFLFIGFILVSITARSQFDYSLSHANMNQYLLHGKTVIRGSAWDPYFNARVLQNISDVYQDGMFINYNSNGGANANLRFFANGTTQRMIIRADNGNVGIGTSAPFAKLTVYNYSALEGNNTINAAVFASPWTGPYASHIHWGNTGDWYIRSASSEGKVIIQDTGGNVGIATSNPASKLDVNGTISFGGKQAIYGNSGNIYHNVRVMQNISDTYQDGMYINYNSNGGENANLRFFANGTTQRMVIRADNGNVGIGTSDPRFRLQVNGAIGIHNVNGDNGQNWGVVGYDGKFVISQRNRSFDLEGDRLTILRNGNVGIGTSNPQSTLAVNGTITAKTIVTTQTGWSDFVFNKDYQLKPLEQVENFIKKNGHLPDVPSAKEVQKNGNTLGETDAILLQKIEELTLYVIELKKENINLKNINQSTNEKFLELENKLDLLIKK